MKVAMLVVGVVCAVAAAEDRILRVETVVDAPAGEVWKAYTTKEGWESWAVPLAEVDFRVGGTIKTNYNKEAGIGGPGTITHHILAYEPERMVVTRFEAPANAGWAKKAEACQVVVRLEPVSAMRTRFVETMVGFGDGPEWDEAYTKFKAGNEWSLEQLRKKFKPQDAGDARSPMEVLRTLVGGAWVTETAGPDGKVLRVRNVIEPTPDGKGLVMRGWLGVDGPMHAHAATQVWVEGGKTYFQNLDEAGGITRGEVRVSGDQRVDWDWNQTTTDGATRRFGVAMEFQPPDAYTMTLSQGEVTLMTVPFKRVAAASIDGSIFPASGMVEGLVKETVVKASPEEVFRMWGTAEGIKSFLGAEARIELRIGGPFEIYFGGADVKPEDRGSIGCQVLSYVPNEMISFSWNAPPKFPAERAQRAWVVVTMGPEGDGLTRVRLVHTGFGEGGQWGEVRAYFDSAWTGVLGALKGKFEKK